MVSIPSEFTLLSNLFHYGIALLLVSIPSEFTLLSNDMGNKSVNIVVSIPSEFTLLSNQATNRNNAAIVSIPSEFTLLSNNRLCCVLEMQFQYPLNLHCSQTSKRTTAFFKSFNTLWIYTALKHILAFCASFYCFNTLWIYTALKHRYDIAKLEKVSIPSEFTLLSNLKFQLLTYLRINPARLLHKFISLIITHFCLLF